MPAATPDVTAHRLLVLDTYDVDVLQSVTAQHDGRWDVLLLGLSESWFRWWTPQVPSADERLRFVDAGALAPRAHDDVRTFVIETLGRLPEFSIAGRPVWRHLEEDLETSWWYTETSEKGPYRTPLVCQLYLLALLDGAIASQRYDEVVIATSHDWLRRLASAGRQDGPAIRVRWIESETPAPRSLAARYWRHAIAAVITVLIVRLIAAMARWPRMSPKGGRTCVFSFYPAWWTAPATQDAAERFFSAPRSDMWFLCWVHTLQWLWTNRRAVATVIPVRRMVVLQRFVPSLAMLQTLSPGRFLRTMRLLRRLRSEMVLSFAGWHVTPLVGADLERSLTGGERFQDELLAEAVAHAARRHRPGWVLYRAEFQPAERAVLVGLCGVARTAGFVHYPFGRNYLSLWDRDRRRAMAIGSAAMRSQQPLPDGMLTCGPVGREHLVESGYPADRIAACGPQRHAGLLRRLSARGERRPIRQALGAADAVPLFLVGVAIVEADTEALFAALREALDEFGPYRLVARTHPNRPEGDRALERAIAALGGEHAALLPRGIDLYDAIEASDAMITIGSTVAFEAMALGCMPVIFENPSTYPATSLADFTDALYVVHDGIEFRSALQQVCDHAPDSMRRRASWPRALEGMFGDLSTDLPAQLSRAIDELSLATATGESVDS